MRQATAEELARWDELVLANPDGGHVFQTRAWGEFKSGCGWKPQFMIHDLGGVQLAVMYLVRRFSYFGELWWVPKGPGVASQAQIASYVASLDLPKTAFMLRINPVLSVDGIDQPLFKSIGLMEAKRDVQPDKATILIDLSRNEEEILAAFKQKTRYNVRLAAKKGVVVEAVSATDENLELMYQLMHETSSRAQYYMRERSYYLNYWRKLSEVGHGQLMFASFEGELLAGLFATYFGQKGWYKDGGSFKKHPEVMAPYLLQWETMRWLRGRGVTVYDLVGVPSRRDLNPESKIYSLYQFKSGFNDEIIEYINSYDLPLSSKFSQWDAWGERLTSKYYMRIKRELLY